ncbi:MAG: 2-phospho-L-lactate guanylyltransferase [Actinobacteria bacterium]|nr:2-phospho-L-lactate guanylyltransferase [Actinomycetota bacterium]
MSNNTEGWTVIIPIKPLPIAKSRLEGTRRNASTADLARAFAKDLVAATTHVAFVDQVIAVTSESTLAPELISLGATVLDEPNQLTGDLNAVLDYAQRQVLSQHPHCAIAIVTADLATIQARSLESFLVGAANCKTGYVADHSGSGTSVLINRTGHVVATAFGARSADAHRERGFDDLTELADARLRLDIDTPEDLESAIAIGLGAATRRLIE